MLKQLAPTHHRKRGKRMSFINTALPGPQTFSSPKPPSPMLQRGVPDPSTIVVQIPESSKKEKQWNFLSGVGMITTALLAVGSVAGITLRVVYKKKWASMVKYCQSMMNDNPEEGGKKLASLMKRAFEHLKKDKTFLSSLSEIGHKVLTPNLQKDMAKFFKGVTEQPEVETGIKTLAEKGAKKGVEAIRNQSSMIARFV
jgi:hypothetical protein